MDNREQFEAWFFDRYSSASSTSDMFYAWQACAEQKDAEIEDSKEDARDWGMVANEARNELQELKDEINRVWYLAYPESPIDERDHAKMRVFNLYQDLVCTRDNYRFLNNAWNKLNEEVKK